LNFIQQAITFLATFPKIIVTIAAIVTTGFAAISAITAIVAILIQLKRARFALKTDSLLKMDDRFHGKGMKKVRKIAAKNLLNKKDLSYVDDVLDFFEMIGYLTRQGALDEKGVWNFFFSWLNIYWHAAEEYITIATEKDPSVWADLRYLYGRLIAIEKHERHCSDSDIVPSEDDLKELLEAESELDIFT
jgi:hypothetical protein